MRSINRIRELLSIEVPIIQAPMAGSQDAQLTIAACRAGGLGSLPCAMLSLEGIENEVRRIRSEIQDPFNLNFFCHPHPRADKAKDEAWKAVLHPYYVELGIEPSDYSFPLRLPFDEKVCEVIEELKPPVVSFHFGLPPSALLKRIKAVGAKLISSATTVEEALWLEKNGCDAIIAQGLEAGGHRGTFLGTDMDAQVGTISLLPRIVDAVRLPVIAAGGISDPRGIIAAFALGASAVQLGSAFLLTTEAKTSPLHREALKHSGERTTVLTNLFTGKPARGIVNRIIRDLGPMSPLAPDFPLASNAIMPLRLAAEAKGLSDFSPLWAGQSAHLAREMAAEQLIRTLWDEAKADLKF